MLWLLLLLYCGLRLLLRCRLLRLVLGTWLAKHGRFGLIHLGHLLRGGFCQLGAAWLLELLVLRQRRRLEWLLLAARLCEHRGLRLVHERLLLPVGLLKV